MPDAGRDDYNHLLRFSQLQPGEPVFLLRAKDDLAGLTVRAWSAFAYEKGAPLAIVEQALQQADAMDAWPTKQRPDADHLSPAEIQQLEYQFDRRAWTAAKVVRPLAQDIVFAERRGARAAESRIRNSDQLLRDVLEVIAPILEKAEGTSPALEKARTVCAAARLHAEPKGMLDA